MPAAGQPGAHAGGGGSLPTYHPSALLRDPSKKKDAWEDMKSLREKLRELGLYMDLQRTESKEGMTE